ncbi:MAG: hypothetical protein HN849_10175 [Victivallales bacterium]|nr:hypothetical protein [Victivallales bacterium]
MTFWHCMVGWEGDQDELRVLYRTSTAGSWTLLETYTTSVPSWTQRTLALPDPGSSYYLAFEGNAKFGYGVCIDDVQVTGKKDQSITFAPLPLKTYGDPDVALGATASSGFAVTYVSSNPGVATILSGALHIVSAGTSTITASQLGDATWTAAAPTQRLLTVDPAGLTCTADDQNRTYGSANPALTITYTGLQNADLAPATPPVIACAAIATSSAGPYDITLTGGSDPNYTLALVNGTLTVSLGVTMRFWVDDDGRITELKFGEADSATSDFDPAWDVVADDPPAVGVHTRLYMPLIIRAEEQDLSSDYRALSDTSRWRLAVSGLAARGSATLTWDVALAAPGREVYLQRIEDEQCVGTPIDMRETSQLELTEDAVFEVVYSIPVTTRISLRSGWNLIGSPVISMQSGKQAFDDGTRAPSYVGSAWHWRGLRYQSWNEDEPLCPERGLWMHCLRDDLAADMTGVQADGVVLLRPGWNLVTPVADCTMPAVPGLGTSAWYWGSGSGAYQRIVVGEPVLAGRGYWFYVSPGAPIVLQLGE